MTKPKIILESRSVCGAPRLFPACELSRLLVNCSKGKTITSDQMRHITEAGYEIEIRPTV